MPDAKKQQYYQDNKEARLSYQRAYYAKNKDLIKRRLSLKEVNDPEWKEKQREYNRAYYKKNRSKILANRAIREAKKAN